MSGIRKWQASDPGRWDLMRWDPFGEMESMRESFSPTVEVKETRDSFIFTADLPGMKEQDIDISVTGNRLTISGKREEEQRHEEDRYYAYERSYGSFARAFTLPNSAELDHVRAHMESGVLRVEIPKKAEVQPRRISIGGQGDSSSTQGATSTQGSGAPTAGKQPSKNRAA